MHGRRVPGVEATAAGDTFDYSLSRGTLHASVTDAMGHDLPAAQLASVLVASLRNSRRHGLDVPPAST